MDIYDKIISEKALRKLSYKDFGSVIGMTEAAFGMALKRKSLSQLQIREIEKMLDDKPNVKIEDPREIPSNEVEILKIELKHIKESLRLANEQIEILKENIELYKSKLIDENLISMKLDSILLELTNKNDIPGNISEKINFIHRHIYEEIAQKELEIIGKKLEIGKNKSKSV